MKKISITVALILFSMLLNAQVGMNCQYFPGLQVGYVSVKTNNAALGNYKYGAGMPLLLIDRISNHWYTNLDFSALYYGATQTNKGNDNRINISKAEGAFCAGRLGYLFGDGDQFRIGPNINLGMSTSNLDSLKKPFAQRSYYNYGLGIVAYKKFGKFRVAGKLGYELYNKKGFITKAHGTYFEGTIGYSFYQKYGLSIMPCFYSKKFDYVTKGGDPVSDATNAKLKSFVLRIGLTRFF